MQKDKIVELAKNYLQKIKDTLQRYLPLLKEKIHFGIAFIRRSWKSIAVILPFGLVLYYSLGGWVTNNIDRSLVVRTDAPQNGMFVIAAAEDLIGREVDEHMWTPNLPFIFPGYILDNMPNYQKGIIQALRTTVNAWNRFTDHEDLKNAAEFLKYPANIWLLSKQKNLALAPSSGAQYRKARRALQNFNQDLPLNEAQRQKLFTGTLNQIQKSMNAMVSSLEKQIRENSSDWVDFKADDVFYFNQGRLYASYILLKALGSDFKTEIVADDVYGKWTSLLKTMEDGINLNPMIVRNGEPEAVFSANHLMALNFYVAKAQSQLSQLTIQLSEGQK